LHLPWGYLKTYLKLTKSVSPKHLHVVEKLKKHIQIQIL